MSFQSDISKLIFHHLVKEGYESSANNLIRECPHLIELKPVQPPYKLPRLMGPSLVNLIENYFETKEHVIEQLELLESVGFREQDDLQNLNKTLVENLKFQIKLTPLTQKETSDAGVNTIDFSQSVPQICDASVNTDFAYNTPETCDASVNTESLSTPKTSDSSCNTESISTPKTSDSSCNTESVTVTSRLETCDASVNTEFAINQEKDDENHLLVDNSTVLTEKHSSEIPDDVDSPEENVSNHLAQKAPTTLSTSEVSKSGCDEIVNTTWILNHAQESSLQCSEQLEISSETIDFSLVYDRLLEDREFQEKIAANINKKKAEVILPSKSNSKSRNLASSQDLDTVIKAIVAETQADPAFDNFLNDCIGIDSEDQSSVSTPDSTAQNGEPTLSQCNVENQENRLVPNNTGETMIVEPSAIASSIFTVQNHQLLDNSSMINGLNSLAIVTSSGQITLVPTIISALSSDAVPSVDKRRKKNQNVRRPIAIAPKPVFTITIPAPDCNYQFPNAVGESEFFEQRVEDQEQLADCNIEKINVESSPGPSTIKPMKVKNRPLAKSRRRKITKPSNTVTQEAQNPVSSRKLIPPGLAALVKIAQEYGSTSVSIQDQEAVKEKENLKSPDVVFNSPVPNATDFVTTPTSTRRLSHVRQLNFGESPELSNKPSSTSPAIHPKRSEIPWDLALRSTVAAPPPPDSEIFATPKGKAKRRRKSSPAPVIEVESVEKTSSSDEVTSTSTFPTIPHQTSFVISSTPAEKNAPPDVVVSERTHQLCDNSDSNYADLVAASILHEMANAPSIEVDVESSKNTTQENGVDDRISPEPNLSHFEMEIITREEPVIQQPLPVLATPRKEMVGNVGGINSINSVTRAMLCESQSNSISFGAWDGEIPRTPQIRLDLTSSTSPFQVSLTKGFRFLPAAESPSLPVPATPCIFEVNSSNTSIETPYTGFYQFPSVLSTPRLEALRQEIMESPGKSLSITVISPTQVVLGRPTPYFVPSGERAQGPANQNATPEHVPETEKLERRRRSSTEMDPLQLEESNDASDAAAALMCKAAETVAAALQPHSPHHPPSPDQLNQFPSPHQLPTPHQCNTPYKTDQTLENDLISECQRLEDDPSTERAKLRNQRLVELFGEDSTNPSEITKSATSVPENAPAVALAQSTPITTKQKTRKPRRTALSKSAPGDESVNSACARVQIYSLSPQAHRRKSRRTNNSKSSTSKEDENLIQEVLALSRLNSSVEPVAQSPLNKRKRRSNSTSRKKSGVPGEASSENSSKRKRINFPGVSKEQSLSTNEVVSISISSSSLSKEDVHVESVSSSSKVGTEGKTTSKGKVKPVTREPASSVFMHQELVNKMRKQLSESEEFDLYSQ